MANQKYMLEFDVDLAKELKLFCIKNDITMRDFITKAIKDALDREKIVDKEKA